MNDEGAIKFKVNEIFKSIQGESSFAGLSCAFVRLSGCNLRCSYCDTAYAYKSGRYMSIAEIVSKTAALDTHIIELTGGEPLWQPNARALIDALVNLASSRARRAEPGIIKPRLLIETSGSMPIENINPEAFIIMDIKTPSSGVCQTMLLDNLNHIKPADEVKFVIGDRKDYEYSRKIILDYRLAERCGVLLSAVYGRVEPRKIIAWMLKDMLKARFQLQLHKYIWPPDKKGV
jgi:7-carboxy-7-deazaguanine synthase